MMAGPNYQNVNTAHPQQDVGKTRLYRPYLHRFTVAEELVPVPPRMDERCLEIGGGMAEFSRRLKEIGYQVTFTDLNSNSVHNAQSLGFESYQMDFNLGLSPLEDSYFDGVVILEVIEHIVQAEFLLSEINRVLKPGGFMVLSTPNFAFWQNRLRILAGQLSADEGYHYRFFTVSSLERQLLNAGFRVETWRFTTPAIGINRVRRWLKREGRKHLQVPHLLASVFSQTMMVRVHK